METMIQDKKIQGVVITPQMAFEWYLERYTEVWQICPGLWQAKVYDPRRSGYLYASGVFATKEKAELFAWATMYIIFWKKMNPVKSIDYIILVAQFHMNRWEDFAKRHNIR